MMPDMWGDAPSYSEVYSIERENELLKKRIEQLEKERDAAVEDINEAAKTGCLCFVCKFDKGGYCVEFGRFISGFTIMCGQYKWRGPKEGK